jgi:exopolysaccharide biosynthesis WecB/TagA/CpsF family protein
MIDDAIAARRRREPDLPKLIFSSNGQGISLAATSRRFAAAMACADVIHADGMSVVLASHLLTSSPLPERVATTDFFHDAAQAAQDAQISFFLLGGSEEENAAACAAARRLFPRLKIAGRHHGYFPAAENASVCKSVTTSGAEVLWVALGKPRQEFWSIENRERLRGVAWIKTCGGLYAFLAGRRRRAPLWMQNVGLEWMFRGVQEPSRLGWRYLVTNPHAMWRMLVDSNTPVARPAFQKGSIDGPVLTPHAGIQGREDG